MSFSAPGKVKNFRAVFQSGLKRHGLHHTSHLHFAQEPAEAPFRCAVVVSKKAVSKRAVLRNRAKRRIRPLMRDILSELHTTGHITNTKPLHWVVRAKASCLECSSADLLSDLRKALTALLQPSTPSSHQPAVANDAKSCATKEIAHTADPNQTHRPKGKLSRSMALFFGGIIRASQVMISPLLGPRCRFFPSCSAYCIQSIQLYGPARGFFRGAKRLMRCHPFSQGGVDLP
jgi:putative membrane protein insertion efficiency factor/ribonuclease P protein component